MRKRKFLIGALLSVVGALVVSGTASAAVTGQTYTVTTSPAKQDKKAFGPVGSFKNVVDTNYSGGFAPFGTQTVLSFSKDIKITPGNIPQCNLSSISTVPQAQADSICGASKVGTGSATINGGLLTGVVSAYNGQPSGGNPTIGLHTDVFAGGTYSFSTTLTGVLNTRANTLSVAIPPTGTAITHFETTLNKKKSGKQTVKVNGKKKKQPTYYVMARCKKKKWVNSETTTYNDGSSTTATSTQKCKQKKSKK
jgi:uncharacterized protein (DUF2141 family)